MSTTRPAEPLEKLEIKLLLEAVFQKYGYDFRDYAFDSIRAKVMERLQAERLMTISAFQDRILHDESVMARFLFIVAARQAELFQEPSFFRSLREKVIPALAGDFFIRVWLVQCSTGEEVFALAMLLEEEGIYDKCRLYVTNMDEQVLKRAKQGIFDLKRIKASVPDYHETGGKATLASYYSEQFGNAVMNPSLRRNIVFAQHNLVTDTSFNEFQLIVSRNILPHFNRDLRDRVHKLFYDSLGMGGYLALGARDTLDLTPFSRNYEQIDEQNQLYKRIK